MKIYFSPASPYVRKVMVAANELGLADRIEKLPSAVHPVNRDAAVIAHNPLGKVPTFFADDGRVLYDSRVICEYLDTFKGGNKLFPREGAARWQALCDQALGDGLLDAALLARYETVARPAEFQWKPWLDGQMDKLRTSLVAINKAATGYRDRVDIGTISIGCALGYLDFRFADYGWQNSYPNAKAWFATFSKRPSMETTLPQG